MPNLVAPIVPSGSDEATQAMGNYIKGFSLIAEMNRRREEQKLEIQQMINDQHNKDAALKQRQDEEKDQVKHWNAEEKIHKAQADSLDETRKYRIGQTDEQLAATHEMMKRINGLTSPKHSQQWRNDVSDVLNDFPEAAKSDQYKSFLNITKREKDPAFRTQQIAFNNWTSNLGMKSYEALEFPEKVQTGLGTGKDEVTFTDGVKEAIDPKTGQKTVVPNVVKMSKDTWDKVQKRYKDLYPDDRPGPSKEDSFQMRPVAGPDTLRSVSDQIKIDNPGIGKTQGAALLRKKIEDMGMRVE